MHRLCSAQVTEDDGRATEQVLGNHVRKGARHSARLPVLLDGRLASTSLYGPRFSLGLNHGLLGCLELVEGSPGKAHRNLQESVPVYREIGQQHGQSWALAMLAVAALKLGDSREAAKCLSHSVQGSVELGAALPLLWALPAASLLLAGRGQTERAVELYALASHYPLVAKSLWFAGVVGEQIKAITTTSPVGPSAVAKSQAQSLDLPSVAQKLLVEMKR